MSAADYPSSALRAEAKGTSAISLTIGADGRVTGCSVTGSAGNSALDSTACSLAQRRFRFEPGRNTRGNAVPSQFAYQMDWRLPR